MTEPDPPQSEEEEIAVLLAEDNPGDAALVEQGLAESNSEVTLTVVRDGDEVLEYLHQRGEYETAPSPDLLFLDFNLPGIRGEDVLQELNSDPELQTIPVFVISGSKAEHDVATAYRHGTNGYFEKPVDPDEYLDLVGMLVEVFDKYGKLPESVCSD